MNLENDLTLLINESHQETWSGFDVVQHDAARYGLNKAQVMKWRNPGEPAFVSNLIERPFGHCKLSAIVHAHLAPLGICAGAPLVSGVFIHQKPKARIKGSRTKIELGDLLFVRQHFRSRHASPEGRAMLLQAKSGQFPCTGLLKGNEAKQFALYAGWTSEFVFPHGEIGSPPDGSAWWNFSKGLTPAPEQSGLYGLVSNSRADAVDVSFPGGCSWAVGMAAVDPTGGAPEVKGAWSLAFALKGLLMGNFGRAWNDRPDSNDHWSHFVIRVLEAAARWQYPSQRIGKANLPRRRDALSFAQELAERSSVLADERVDQASILESSTASYHAAIARENLMRLHIDARGWSEGLGPQAVDDGPPVDFFSEQGALPPQGGVSVLYIATFGDNGLNPPGTMPVDREPFRGT